MSDKIQAAKKEIANKEIAKAASSDGGLFSLGWYLSWSPSSEQAALDGEFTSAELRAIADYMDEHYQAKHSAEVSK